MFVEYYQILLNFSSYCWEPNQVNLFGDQILKDGGNVMPSTPLFEYAVLLSTNNNTEMSVR